MDVEKLVTECPLFRQIDPKDLAAMLKCLSARVLTAQRGEFIETTSGGKPLMGVVLEGSVEMISEDYFGKKSILTLLTVGNLFGETYSCLQARNRTVAFQVRDACRVLNLVSQTCSHPQLYF